MDGLSEDDLKEKHKRERKELQSKIQGIKKAVPKGDKKRKKEATEEIAKLEAELDQRNEAELQELQNHGQEEKQTVQDESTIIGELSLQDPEEKNEQTEQKMSKAQRRRNKKAAQDKEKQQRIEEEDAKNVNSSRALEYEKINAILKARGLGIKEIPSDGHCLYKAIAHQLQRRRLPATTDGLRHQTATYMRTHAEEFRYFLSKPETGNAYNEEEYEKYCNDIATTAAWGGQPEINALSNVLELPIEVIQADGPNLLTGESLHGPPVILSYHRHAYGLGEHYNSVIPASEVQPADDNEEET